VQTEKLEFTLSKMCLQVAKRLAQNRTCKLELKNGIFENYHLLPKNCLRRYLDLPAQAEGRTPTGAATLEVRRERSRTGKVRAARPVIAVTAWP
jgi:hypothetical protein